MLLRGRPTAREGGGRPRLEQSKPDRLGYRVALVADPELFVDAPLAVLHRARPQLKQLRDLGCGVTGAHQEDNHHLPLSEQRRDDCGRGGADGRHADLRSDVSGTLPRAETAMLGTSTPRWQARYAVLAVDHGKRSAAADGARRSRVVRLGLSPHQG